LYYRLRKHGLEHVLPTKGVVGSGPDGPNPEVAERGDAVNPGSSTS
jgi:hypothetical protein